MVGATLTQPQFVNHENGAILSIDCHPSHEKFLTCGQKGNSRNGLVAVWNMAPVLDKSKSSEKTVPKMLFQVEASTTANTCRWAPDGHRFAFGSDDSSVSVWEYVGRIKSAGSVTGGTGNVERYKEVCVLRGHSMEVLAVEWSQNNRFLASSSMDHKILIYNSRKLPDRIAVLSGSESAVKGLSWDPIGKYLASLEGDKRLKLWATDSWQCVTTIDEPFEDSKEETMFSRLDWSPDGKYLLTPAAVKDGQPLIKLIQRQTWRADHHLAGHRKGTTCVRSLPYIVKSELKNGKRAQLTCAAVGSRDKSVSIWLFPATLKPVMVIDNMFHHSVMDFAWCGMNLLVCSQDGTVKVITLEEQLIGQLMDDADMSDLCYSMYSTRPPQFDTRKSVDEGDGEVSMHGFPENCTSVGNSSFLINPDDVLNQKKKLAENELTTSVTAQKPVQNEENLPKDKENREMNEQKLQQERSKQTESKGKDGKRRIQPIFLASTAVDAPSSSTPSTSEAPVTSSGVPAPRRIPTVPVPVENPPQPPRKRLAEGEIDLETSTDEEDSDEDEEDEEESEDEEDEDMETSGDEKRTKKKKRMEKKQKRKRELTRNEEIMAMDLKKPVLRPMEPKSMITKEGTVVMEAPEQQAIISHQVQDRKGQFVEVDNRWKHGGIETSQVKLVKRRFGGPDLNGDDEERRTITETIWMAINIAPVIIVSANKHYVVLGCADKCVRVYRTLCGSLVISLRLDSLPVLVGIKEHSCYALTQYGRLSTWILKTMKAVMVRQALFDCVEMTSPDNSLLSVDVSETGVPLIVFSNGSIYTYHLGLDCWIQAITTNALGRLTSSISDAFLDDFYSARRTSSGGPGTSDATGRGAGPLTRLLKRMRRQSTAVGVSPLVSRAVKEAQLEQLLQCAEQLGNPHDYQTMLRLYVETLCESGSEKKLKNVINELSRNGAPLQVCGLRRAAIYDDVSRMVRSRQPQIAERIVAGVTTTSQGASTIKSLF